MVECHRGACDADSGHRQKDKDRADRPEHSRGSCAKQRNQSRDQKNCYPPKFDRGIPCDQVVDRGCMNINAGDRIALEVSGYRFLLDGASRRAQPLNSGGESFRRQYAILRRHNGPKYDDLVLEPVPKVFLVVFLGAETQIGK